MDANKETAAECLARARKYLATGEFQRAVKVIDYHLLSSVHNNDIVLALHQIMVLFVCAIAITSTPSVIVWTMMHYLRSFCVR